MPANRSKMEDILGFVVPQSDANSLFMNIRESRFQHKAGCLLDALLTGISRVNINVFSKGDVRFL